MRRTTVKFCGFRTIDGIKKAIALDIDALGFILVPNRKRTVQEKELQKMVALVPEHLMTVGVLMNPTLESIADWLSVAPLSAIQLHGDESPAFCRQFKQQFPTIRLIKVFHMDSTMDEEAIQSYQQSIDIALLDSSFAGLRGGTGKRFDWTQIPNLANRFKEAGIPFWVAGGIDSTNVGQLVETYQPDGIDVSSGIERNGMKNREVMEELIEKVRNIDNLY